MSKQRESKLDRYAETLLAMDDEKKTLVQIQAWLKEEGCVVALSTLGSYLESARSARLQARLLGQITSGARQCAEVEKQFGKNPAPALETLIKLQRVILLDLSTKASANPALLDLIGNSFKAVLTAEKLKLQREEYSLDRERFELESAALMLDKALREKADEINASSLSQADKIAAMRKAAFADVEALKASGKLKLPK